MQFCRPEGNVFASLWSGVCFCPPHHHHPRHRGRGGLQLCPYSQHLTKGPRCAHVQQQQFEQLRSTADRGVVCRLGHRILLKALRKLLWQSGYRKGLIAELSHRSQKTAGLGRPAAGRIHFTQTGRGGLGDDGASYSQFHARPTVVGRGDSFPRGGRRLAQLEVELGLPAVEPPPADAEVNAEVEERHRDERREELQHGGTQQEVPRVIELCKALILWHVSPAHHQFPEYDSRAVQEKGQHPDSNHLGHGLMGHALSVTISAQKNSYDHKGALCMPDSRREKEGQSICGS
ncbi:hypothetical protein EYF80_040779 [Liparis tanakae]|uniref:Uncharacterized protein n=1 Tax=Liparis tanakae TaxID=230148 RepID=A0A4Z2G624_9TELE|nr:hypothetical protein EYF80_040779 [Liparis tanakae]